MRWLYFFLFGICLQACISGSDPKPTAIGKPAEIFIHWKKNTDSSRQSLVRSALVGQVDLFSPPASWFQVSEATDISSSSVFRRKHLILEVETSRDSLPQITQAHDVYAQAQWVIFLHLPAALPDSAIAAYLQKKLLPILNEKVRLRAELLRLRHGTDYFFLTKSDSIRIPLSYRLTGKGKAEGFTYLRFTDNEGSGQHLLAAIGPEGADSAFFTLAGLQWQSRNATPWQVQSQFSRLNGSTAYTETGRWAMMPGQFLGGPYIYRRSPARSGHLYLYIVGMLNAGGKEERDRFQQLEGAVYLAGKPPLRGVY